MPGCVLVIDDERGMRVTLREFLSEDGHRVEVAESAEQALEIVSRLSIDVVLCDIILPDSISGVDLVRLIRDHQPDVEVILMTGDPALETAVSAMRIRAVDYLSKPIDSVTLRQTVSHAVKIKQLGDENRRLDQENRDVRQELEERVRQRTKELEENQANYRNLVDTASDGICILERGIIRFANKRLQDMLSTTESGLVGRSIEDFLPEGSNPVLSLYWSFQQGGRDLGIVPGRLKTDQGRILDVELNGSPILHEDRPCELILIRDVTDKRKAEERERRYLQKLELLSKVSLGIVDFPQDQILYEYAANAIAQLVDESIVIVSSFNTTSSLSRVEAVAGLGEFESKLHELIGGSLVGRQFPIDPMGFLGSSTLEQDTKNLYQLAEGTIPEALCQDMERLFDIDKIYVAGFAWRDEVYGSVIVIQSTRGGELFPSILETFCNQIAVALQREQARRSVRENERLFRMIFEAANDCIFIKNRELEYVQVNPSMERLFGLPAKELIGKTDLDLFGKDFGEAIQRSDAHVLSGEEIKEEPTKPVNGIPRTFDTIKIPLRDDRGEIVGLVGSARDITERKRSETALRESEEKFRILSDQAMLGLAIFQAGNIVYMNRALAGIFGYEDEELRHRTARDLLNHVLEEDRESLTGVLLPDESGKLYQGSQHSFRVTNRFQETVWVDAYARTVEYQGRRASIMAFVDTTVRRRAEESLRRSEQRYRTLVENAPLGILSADKDGNILELNMPLLEILGSRSAQDTRAINLLSNPRLAEAGISDDCRRCLQDGEPIVSERMYISKWDKSVYLRYHMQPTKNERGQIVGLQAIVEDISRQKQEEQERARLENQLFKSQKMDSIGKLAGGIAHDFNNLLTGITGHVELARLDLNANDPLADALNEIHRAAKRAESLTQQLLAFGRKQILEPELVDLNNLVRNLQGLLVRLIGENIEFRSILPRKTGAVKVDPGQMEQVVVNLALNARDAMPEGGRLTISTSQAVLDAAFCQDHESLVPGEYVRLSVEDTGCGMTPEIQSRIFEPFFSTKPRDKASGLGLSMVYGIVRQHEGALEVYSHPGAGSTFNIYFPLIHEEVRAVREPDMKPTLPGGNEGILLVEDDRLVREMTAKVLARLGYQVLQARNGGEALLLFQKYHKGLQLVLTDVIMPGMSGRALAERIENLDPTMRFLYISGYTEHEIVTRQVLNEGLHFLEKPFTPSDLAMKIRQVLSE